MIQVPRRSRNATTKSDAASSSRSATTTSIQQPSSDGLFKTKRYQSIPQTTQQRLGAVTSTTPVREDNTLEGIFRIDDDDAYDGNDNHNTINYDLPSRNYPFNVDQNTNVDDTDPLGYKSDHSSTTTPIRKNGDGETFVFDKRQHLHSKASSPIKDPASSTEQKQQNNPSNLFSNGFDDDDDDDDTTHPSMDHSNRQRRRRNRKRINWKHVYEQLQCMIRMALPYFYESRQAKVLVVQLIVCLLLNQAIGIVFSYINRNFWNALSEKDAFKFYTTFMWYMIVLVMWAPASAMYQFAQNQLTLHWRTWLTTRTIQLYMTHPIYYTLEIQRLCDTKQQRYHDLSPSMTCNVDDINNNDMDSAHKTNESDQQSRRTARVIDNPDQRISEDVDEFTSLSIYFVFDTISSILTFGSYSYILYTIYPNLIALAILYTALGSIITMYFFHPMVLYNMNHLKYEANLRYSLVRFREYIECIAIYGKPASVQESNLILTNLYAVTKNQYQLNLIQRIYDCYTFCYTLIIDVAPILVVAPAYFAGKQDMGVINQSVGAFARVVMSLSTLVVSFDSISPYAANIERLSRFYQAIANADLYKKETYPDPKIRMKHMLRVSPPFDKMTYASQHREQVSPAPNNSTFSDTNMDIEMSVIGDTTTSATSTTSNAITLQLLPSVSSSSCNSDTDDATKNMVLQIEDLHIMTPDQKRILLDHMNVTVYHGRHLLIAGPSGVGKSSLLRSIAGLWTSGTGTIRRPHDTDIYFISQRPYCTIGTLRDQLLYPSILPKSSSNVASNNDMDEMIQHHSGMAVSDGVMDWSFRSVHQQQHQHVDQYENNHHDDNEEETDGHPATTNNNRIVEDEVLLEILQSVHLLDIAIRVGDGNALHGLYTSMDWCNVLSMGEQQRLSFGRCMVQHRLRPKSLIILDEATSALDIENETQMYTLLQNMVSSSIGGNLTYISVGHRPSLQAYHKERLQIDKNNNNNNSNGSNDDDATLVRYTLTDLNPTTAAATTISSSTEPLSLSGSCIFDDDDVDGKDDAVLDPQQPQQPYHVIC